MKQIAAILLLFFVFIVASVFAQQPPPEAQIPELARQLNVWRLNEGLEPLMYNESLERMAASQADFLITQPSLPGNIHAGAQGEDPRARSQFPQFAWPTYGHPEIISVTEIAAIGSIASAIDFWQHSDIHNRSVTNPAYREVGVAARQYGSDIMFIVVLGGQPDVLPALMDIENKQIYLTTERAEWQGVWIGDAIEYRLLDTNEQPVTDWLEWERIIDFPAEDIMLEATTIEYRDANDKRAHYPLIDRPQWSSIPVPDIVANVQPTPTATNTLIPGVASPTEESAGIFSTNTPAPEPTITLTPHPTMTPFPTFTPTFTPVPGSARLFYTEEVFALYNSGSSLLDISGISFKREDVGFVGRFWEEVSDILNIQALPPMECVTIEPESELTFTAPEECIQVRSIVQEPNPRYFWLEEFEVLNDGVPIGTCPGVDAGGVCDIVLD